MRCLPLIGSEARACFFKILSDSVLCRCIFYHVPQFLDPLISFNESSNDPDHACTPCSLTNYHTGSVSFYFLFYFLFYFNFFVKLIKNSFKNPKNTQKIFLDF